MPDIFWILKIGAASSAAFAAIALTGQLLKTVALGRKRFLAPASGDAFGGMLYAFGPGMMPWAKESAAKHLPTYFAGVIYHLGIFAALAEFCLQMLGLGLPQSLTFALQIPLSLGLIAGGGLLAKRFVAMDLRSISLPDDFVANILTSLFIASALLATFAAEAAPALFAAAIPLFVYIPLGKIRHCFFFFYSRAFFGLWLGRRGVFPPKAKGV